MAGAVHIPMAQLPGRIAEIPAGTRIVNICRSGNRSGKVTAWLLNKGFDAVSRDDGARGTVI